MKTLERIFDGICRCVKMAAALLLAIMLVISLIEIVRRYLLGQSFSWADELVRYCIVGVAMLGGASAFREIGGLVAFDLISAKLRGTAGIVVAFAINTISLLFAGYMFGNAVKTLQTPSVYKQVSIGLKVSMFWPYLPIAIGLGLTVIFAIERYITLYADVRAGKFDKIAPPASERGEQA